MYYTEKCGWIWTGRVKPDLLLLVLLHPHLSDQAGDLIHHVVETIDQLPKSFPHNPGCF